MSSSICTRSVILGIHSGNTNPMEILQDNWHNRCNPGVSWGLEFSYFHTAAVLCELVHRQCRASLPPPCYVHATCPTLPSPSCSAERVCVTFQSDLCPSSSVLCASICVHFVPWCLRVAWQRCATVSCVPPWRPRVAWQRECIPERRAPQLQRLVRERLRASCPLVSPCCMAERVCAFQSEQCPSYSFLCASVDRVPFQWRCLRPWCGSITPGMTMQHVLQSDVCLCLSTSCSATSCSPVSSRSKASVQQFILVMRRSRTQHPADAQRLRCCCTLGVGNVNNFLNATRCQCSAFNSHAGNTSYHQ